MERYLNFINKIFIKKIIYLFCLLLFQRKVDDDSEIEEIKNKVASKRGKKSDKKEKKLSDDETQKDSKIESNKKKPTQATLDKFNIQIKPAEGESEYKNLPEIPEGAHLKICSWNVNGLRAMINKGAIEKFVKEGKN